MPKVLAYKANRKFQVNVRMSKKNRKWMLDRMEANGYSYMAEFIDDLLLGLREMETEGKAPVDVLVQNAEKARDRIRRESRQRA